MLNKCVLSFPTSSLQHGNTYLQYTVESCVFGYTLTLTQDNVFTVQPTILTIKTSKYALHFAGVCSLAFAYSSYKTWKILLSVIYVSEPGLKIVSWCMSS